MCGRFTLTSDAKKLAGHFKAVIEPRLEPRFNVCPTQPVPVVRDDGRGSRTLGLVRWGLAPGWADDIAIGQKLINARSETAAEKPAFRSAMKYRRCLVPADGFYEWTAGAGTKKQPHYIQLADESPMGFAGLWEHWQDAQGNELETCTILTTSANAMLAHLHDRMPVILDPGDYARWLDPAQQDPAAVTDLLRPFPAEQMIHRPVSTRVNNVRNDDASLLEPEQRSLFP